MGMHNSHARYVCKYCNYCTDRRNLYQQHEKSHFSQGEEPSLADGRINVAKSRIRCPKCPYHCSAEHLLSSHMKMHESDQRYVCSICKFSTANCYAFNEHLEFHKAHPNMPSQQSETDKHNDNESVPEDEKYDENESDDEYSCDLCSFSTTSIDDMRLHESQHEGFDEKISCPYCSFTCIKEDDIKQHVIVHQSAKSETATDDERKEMTKMAPEDLSIKRSDPSSLLQNPDEGNHVRTAKSDISSASVNIERRSDDNDQKFQVTVDHVESSLPAMTDPPHDSYTCQYCERQFKDKSLMQAHEKQHLQGYENLEAVQ